MNMGVGNSLGHFGGNLKMSSSTFHQKNCLPLLTMTEAYLVTGLLIVLAHNSIQSK